MLGFSLYYFMHRTRGNDLLEAMRGIMYFQKKYYPLFVMFINHKVAPLYITGSILPEVDVRCLASLIFETSVFIRKNHDYILIIDQ